jgi:hypothetical protein
MTLEINQQGGLRIEIDQSLEFCQRRLALA